MSQAALGAEIAARLERLPFSRWHYILGAMIGFVVLLDAADFAIFGAALPLLTRDFQLTPTMAGLMATVGLAGASVGALFWGTVSDYIGRRASILATLVIFPVFTGLTAIATTPTELAVYRFVTNFGLGGCIPVGLTIVAEFMPTAVRGRVTSLVLAAFPIGLVVAAGVSLAVIPVFGWRPLFAIGVFPLLLVIPVYLLVPESVRYLISRGAFERGWRQVRAIETAVLGSPPDLVLVAPTNVRPSRPSITVLELLSAERLKTTSLMWVVSFCFFWASNGILFMLPTILTQQGMPLSEAIRLTLVQGIFGFLGYVTCGFLIDLLGRRPVLCCYFFAGSLFHIWFALATGLWLYPAIACVGWVNPGVYGPLGVYVSELHPTHLRATAVGWFFGIGRIGSFIAPFAIGLMLANGRSQYVLYSFAAAYLLAAVAVTAVGIETRGRMLEQAGS